MEKKDLERRLAIIEEKLGVVNETLKLKVGTWYKYPNYENWKLCITSIDGDGVRGYGVDLNGGWMKSGKWGVIEDVLDKLIECTPKEVGEALIKEAKRRGYKSGVTCIFGDVKEKRTISSDLIQYTSWSSPDGLDKGIVIGNDIIFTERAGEWAEIIELDKFAELKEAHRNGAVIEYRHTDKNRWEEIDTPVWNPNCQYRIKPEEEPNVGDIVKVWDAKEGKFFIGTLYKKGIYDVPYPFMVKLYNSRDDYNFYGNAEKITKQEAIDLLFK